MERSGEEWRGVEEETVINGNKEWHISASIAEIGISVLECTYETAPSVTPTPSNNPNPNAKSEELKGKEKETKRDTSGILRESIHITLDGVQVRTETFGNELSVVACADVVQV
jgi:hypothetical protein